MENSWQQECLEDIRLEIKVGAKQLQYIWISMSDTPVQLATVVETTWLDDVEFEWLHLRMSWKVRHGAEGDSLPVEVVLCLWLGIG